ncbi:hypothetical protein ACFL20_13840 [Spirochaetota bacterium]
MKAIFKAFFIVSVFVLFSFAGTCDSSSKKAPALTEVSHAVGFGNMDCLSQCHLEAPDTKHEEYTLANCGSCHGGNGAYNPSIESYSGHDEDATCLSCHSFEGENGPFHPITTEAGCVNCHFASSGTVDPPLEF